MQNNRRTWFKQSALLLGALALDKQLFATEKKIDQPVDNRIFLNSNENAYGPSPLAKQAIVEHYGQTNRYPDDMIEGLRKKIAAHWSVGADNILMGAGSSEIIGISLMVAGANLKKEFLVADPAYSVWNSQATALGYTATRIPVNSDRKYDLDKMLARAGYIPPAFVYICNPNNPVGTFVDPDKIKKFAEALPKESVVFIDEAYTEYAGLPSLASYAISKPNVVVAKTFSKIYGLAGARVGYAIAHPSTIKKLAAYQPWPNSNISLVSVAAATASLDDTDFVNDCKQKNEQVKESFYPVLKELQLEYIPSSANFILFNISKLKKDLVKEMETRNIYVQRREHFGGKWCRVTVGTADEMKQFVNALKEIVA